ncbi:MAG: flavodoxin domain-containing protein [Chloroflexi bacterium]|nr:flavodoxin domain-containing protein [Chloroflexota bacterium]
MTKVLVAYASKHHATAEIANAIAEVLLRPGKLQVDVRPVETVTTIAPYDAIVLGSSVYIGQWQPEAAEFLKDQEAELAKRPVWFFSSGPTGEGDPNTLMKGWIFPEKLHPIAERIRPRDTVLFHGKLDPSELNLLERAAVKMIKAPVGDFREWDHIYGWAEIIEQELAEYTPA